MLFDEHIVDKSKLRDSSKKTKSQYLLNLLYSYVNIAKKILPS